ncbi:MAG: phenylalanine--tRNA ligase subunit beta [Alphaproteobacteria bacterium]
MKFTLSWLKDHLDTDAELNVIANKLTMIGLEVEEIVDPADTLSGFKIAEITSAEKHPDADKLKVCSVNNGTETLQIVCGAPNARAGIKVVLAPIGTYIPAGDFEIKKGNIRGVESCGMMCSFEELGLNGDSEGIIELSNDAPVGESYVKWAKLDDPMIEIAITPNRGDCLGVRGIARDLAAAGIGKLKHCHYADIEIDSGDDGKMSWDITTENAPAVSGRLFTDVKNVESPDWMKNRLSAIGINPKTALVDITNYVSYELGRPLHAFDADKVGDKLTIRSAKSGEKISALDENEYELDDTMTVIADDKTVHAIGGIMGGMDSAVSESTTNVFIESAFFDPINIAHTGRKLGILSDARYRFERTVNPLSNDGGVKAATKLITEICGGTAHKTVRAGTPKFEPQTITLNMDNLAKRSGIEVDVKQAETILSDLGFKPTVKGKDIECVIPSRRPDVEGEHCLIEEVLRIYGFDKIPAVDLPKESYMSQNILTPLQKKIGLARRALAGVGMNEVITYAFMNDKDADLFSQPDNDYSDVNLINPISADLNRMRPSILPNLLGAYNRNKARGIADIGLFEVGGTYKDTSPNGQINKISGIRAGNMTDKHWDEKQRKADVFDVKADCISALNAMGINTDNLQVDTNTPSWYHPGQSGVLKMGKFELAHFGAIHPSVMKKLGIKGSAFGFEINLDELPPAKDKGKSRPLFNPSQFQAVNRDFAFEVDITVPAGDIIKSANVDKNVIKDITIFDVFAGEGMEAGKKSIAINVTMQDAKKTMSEEDIETMSSKIVDSVIKATGGILR